MTSRILETYKNYVMTHVTHIQRSEKYMALETMCNFTSEKNDLPHCKCVLRRCSNCPSLVIPGQDSNRDDTKMCLTIKCHVYILVSLYTVHVRCSYEEISLRELR